MNPGEEMLRVEVFEYNEALQKVIRQEVTLFSAKEWMEEVLKNNIYQIPRSRSPLLCRFKPVRRAGNKKARAETRAFFTTDYVTGKLVLVVPAVLISLPPDRGGTESNPCRL